MSWKELTLCAAIFAGTFGYAARTGENQSRRRLHAGVCERQTVHPGQSESPQNADRETVLHLDAASRDARLRRGRRRQYDEDRLCGLGAGRPEKDAGTECEGEGRRRRHHAFGALHDRRQPREDRLHARLPEGQAGRHDDGDSRAGRHGQEAELRGDGLEGPPLRRPALSGKRRHLPPVCERERNLLAQAARQCGLEQRLGRTRRLPEERRRHLYVGTRFHHHALRLLRAPTSRRFSATTRFR